MIASSPLWRWREREWTWFALALAAASVLFSLWPNLDLLVSSVFRDATGFPANRHPAVRVPYLAVPWLARAAFVAAVVILLAGARTRMSVGARRRWVALALSLLLGVGALVNGVLKEGWGRARPAAVAEFGGVAQFVPALRPTRECRTNCSFVSGHAATGFALASIGLLGAPAARRRWLIIGMAVGFALGAMRIAQGAHFASDVAFSGLAMWGCHLAMRAAWLRLAARRRSRLAARPRGCRVNQA